MSKIRQELEFYRLGNTIETEIGGDNVSDLYNNTYATSGQIRSLSAGTSDDHAINYEQLTGSPGLSGYQQFPNGIMMVWGQTTSLELTAQLVSEGPLTGGHDHSYKSVDLFSTSAIMGTPHSVTFSQPFATTCYNVAVTICSDTVGGNDAMETMYQIQNISNTGFDIKFGRNYGLGIGDYFKFHYQAIGDWDITA